MTRPGSRPSSPGSWPRARSRNAWAERLGSRTVPPDVADLVVPDPGKLRDAGIAGAVDLVNQTRFLQENGTGPCDGCAHPESGNDNGGPGRPDEPPVEPVP